MPELRSRGTGPQLEQIIHPRKSRLRGGWECERQTPGPSAPLLMNGLFILPPLPTANHELPKATPS